MSQFMFTQLKRPNLQPVNTWNTGLKAWHTGFKAWLQVWMPKIQVWKFAHTTWLPDLHVCKTLLARVNSLKSSFQIVFNLQLWNHWLTGLELQTYNAWVTNLQFLFCKFENMESVWILWNRDIVLNSSLHLVFVCFAYSLTLHNLTAKHTIHKAAA